MRLVVDSQDHLADTDGGQRLDLVQHHGLVAKLHERLGFGERQRAEARAKTADQDQALHGGDGGGGPRAKWARAG